ncbi:MAG: IS21-like element helper ATPase IstB [Bacteroidota bacterium]|nr:IS21-like element helper ATPase IstB [Bacteroidota bacterium]
MKQIETHFSQLRLSGMGRHWQSLVETRKVNELSLVEGLEILLQAEQEERINRRFERLQKNAKFRYRASIEEIDYSPERGINKDLLANLATCEYISKGESVLISGATGCGKSFIASALGHQACVHGKSVAYFNTHKLMARIKMTRMDGSMLKFFDKLAKTSLLILDDFGLTNIEQQQQFDLMEIIEDRHARLSTIIASQLPVSSWFDVIGEATIADAILDRLVHTSHRIELKGDTLRKKKK